MCARDATSEEHVPPKCLFPEKKDLPIGFDLRKSLLKVPSCDIHNTAKSKDDEYLLYILCMNIANNAVAFKHFSTKVMRAYYRKPSLMKSIIEGHHPVVAVDGAGTAYNTIMVKADMSRTNKCFDHMARALYFKKYEKKFDGECRFIHDWAIKPDTKDKVLVKHGDKEISVLEHVKNYFSNLEHSGDNPQVFRYRLEEPDERGLIALSMQFYGGSNTFIALIPENA